MEEARESNPLLEVSVHPALDRVRPEHVEPAVEHWLAAARAAHERVKSAEGPRSWENTARPLDDATAGLEYAMAVLNLLESVATGPALREVYNRVQPRVSAFYAQVLLDPGLYAAVCAYAETEEAQALTGPRRRYLTETLASFRRNGARLEEEGKEKLRSLVAELSALTTRFSQNVLDSTQSFELLLTEEARLAGLPPSAVAMARESARSKGLEGWRFTLSGPSYVAVMTYLDDASVRERVWRAYNTRATEGERDNRPLLEQILRKRREQAQLLGFADFADYVLEERMARTGARAWDFVQELTQRTQGAFARERAELERFARERTGDASLTLAPWDVSYYAEKLRRARFDFDEEQLRPYFSVPRVLEGLFETARALYGVQIEAAPEVAGWHPDVRTFALREGDRALGYFYVDLHPREGKRDGAWMQDLVSFRHGEGPQVGLFCANVSPPTEGRAALLSHDEVQTLFHEFGHLLHHLLSAVEVRALSGTRVAWDFVELPSQVMENWTWERQALDRFARHVDTGEVIPEELFARMLRARTYRAATAQMRQLSFAATDLALHREWEPSRDGDPTRFARGVMAPYTAAELPEDYAMIASFGHLFSDPVGYAAGYYSYKWAEVLDADVFSRFQREGVFSASVGREFRERVLSRGNGEDPAVLFRDFMGRDPRLEALLERSGLGAASA